MLDHGFRHLRKNRERKNAGLIGVSHREVLRRMAEETGGRAFFPFEARDLEANFQEISRELRSQYSLAYVSSNDKMDGTFRTVSIEPLEKNVKVRAKNGYFAPSP